MKRFVCRCLFFMWLVGFIPSAFGKAPVADTSCPVVQVEVERLPDLNTPREGHAVFFAGGQLVVAGGHTAGFVPTPTAEYLSDGEWHQLAMTYTHDHGTVLVLRNGKVLLAGGSKEEMGVGQTYGVELYDPASHSFTGFGCMEQRRTLASAIELDSGQVIITGNWYADDGIEQFDGHKTFTPLKSVSVGRVVPLLFRTSEGDVLILSNRDTRDHAMDTVIVDRLLGEPFTVPLLQHWKPHTYNAPTIADAGFIGNEAQGQYAYLMAVKDYKPVGKDSVRDSVGQIAVMLVEDTVFTLLPTACPIPMTSPFGTGPIFYERERIVADRHAGRAYLCGVDGEKRLYVVAINYAQRPAPMTFYYTVPLPDCGFYTAALTPQGNLAIVGGSAKPDYTSDNFTPTASAWLIRLGEPEDDLASSGTGLARWLWWLQALVAGVGLVFIVRYVIGRHRASDRVAVTPAPIAENRDEQLGSEANLKSRDELFDRICHLMDEQQLFRRSELKAADVAVELGTNSRYVTDCIKDCCDMTFTQFVNKYRIDYAIGLLRQNPNRKILELYTDAGFSSERSFYRVFKEVTGLTTTDWLSQNIG